jgi:hypothetical protein
LKDLIVIRSRKSSSGTTGAYEQIIRDAFFRNWQEGCREFVFSRDEIAGLSLGLSPKNIGDIIYTYRYRRPLPDDILAAAPKGRTWIIEGAGDGLYRFRAVAASSFEPSVDAPIIILPDHTPEEVLEHGSTRDEQAVLATLHYNRILDLFMWCRLERKQSHWRTKVTGLGQIEIDDVYIGVDGKTGDEVVVTVQAKRDRDRVNAVQIMQDIRACRERDDGRVCRPVAVHYDSLSRRLALMEFGETACGTSVNIVAERHYLLRRKIAFI